MIGNGWLQIAIFGAIVVAITKPFGFYMTRGALDRRPAERSCLEPNIAPSCNAAPTDPLPVVRYDAKAGERSLDVMRWGLGAVLGEGHQVGFLNINAMSKPSAPNRPSAGRSIDGVALYRSTTSMNHRRP
jgi:hypothetical protein